MHLECDVLRALTCGVLFVAIRTSTLCMEDKT